jgi:uncharacterized lipoprotein YmbA
MKKLLTVTLLLFCSSCIQLGGDSPPLRYYLLQPNEAAQPLPRQSTAGVTLEPISFPAYLDRPQLTTRNEEHQVIIAPFERWAEPLEENFSRILQENLSRHLRETRIGSLLRHANDGKNRLVKISINSFDGRIGQQIAVDIRFTITASDSQEPIQQGRFIDNAPVGDGYPELVRTLNSALDNFSYTLAQALAK